MHLSDNSSEINQNLSASARDISQDKSISYSLETLISFLKFNVFLLSCTSELSGSHFNSRFNCGEHFLSDTHLSEAVSWSKFMERYLIVCIFGI